MQNALAKFPKTSQTIERGGPGREERSNITSNNSLGIVEVTIDQLKATYAKGFIYRI